MARVDVVRRYRRAARRPWPPAPRPRGGGRAAAQGLAPRLRHLASGSSTRSGSPPCTTSGSTGEGVIVAVFDAGFNNLAHEAFAAMHIVATRDFVNGDDDVADGATSARAATARRPSPSSAASAAASSSAPPSRPASSSPRPRTRRARRRSRRTTGRPRRSGRRRWARTSSAAPSATSTTTAPFPSYTSADMNGRHRDQHPRRRPGRRAGRGGRELRGQRGLRPARTTPWARPRTATSSSRSARSARPAARASFSSVGPTADGRIKPDVAAQGVVGQDRAPRRHVQLLHHRERDVVLLPAHRGRGRAPPAGRTRRPRRTQVATRCAARPARPARRTTCWATGSWTRWPRCAPCAPQRLP